MQVSAGANHRRDKMTALIPFYATDWPTAGGKADIPWHSATRRALLSQLKANLWPRSGWRDGSPCKGRVVNPTRLRRWRTSMLKAMTSSLAAGALLLGFASTALAATSAHVRARHAAHHTNTVVSDAPQGLLGMDCTIKGTYHDWPYCYGSNQLRGTRMGASIHNRGAY